MIRLLPGHACLKEPQLVGLVIRREGRNGAVAEHLVSSDDVARAIRGDVVWVAGGRLMITPPYEAVREPGDDG